jgi:hypothetical protein
MLAFITMTVVIVGTILAVASRKPDEFTLERRIKIDAVPEKIFPFLDDTRRAAEWSPWDKKDPAMKKTHSGAAKGVGSVYEWDGNREIGAGRLEIVEASFPTKVVMDMQFLRPMKARNISEYVVTPLPGGGCEVRWSIRGPSPMLSKVMCLFIDMDAMIGREFEAGLSSLKTLAEK